MIRDVASCRVNVSAFTDDIKATGNSCRVGFANNTKDHKLIIKMLSPPRQSLNNVSKVETLVSELAIYTSDYCAPQGQCNVLPGGGEGGGTHEKYPFAGSIPVACKFVRVAVTHAALLADTSTTCFSC